MAQFANAFAHVPNEGVAAPAGGAGAYRSPLPSPHRGGPRSPSPYGYRGRSPLPAWAGGPRYNSRSPSPYRYRGRSPLPALRLANPPNIFRIVEEARREEARRAVNAELRRMRALVPNAYEEDGIIVIPRAAQILAAPAPLRAAAPAPLRAGVAPQIRATGPPVPEEPDNPRPLNNNNNVNPQPRRNHRRRTRRRASRQRRLRR